MVENSKGNIEIGERPRQEDFSDVPHIFANGFGIGLSNSDISLVLKLDGRPVQVVHLSYTLAKTLEKKMGNSVQQFEKAVGREMLITDEIDVAFAKLQEDEEREG